MRNLLQILFSLSISIILSGKIAAQCGSTNRALNHFDSASSATQYHLGPAGVDGSTINGSSWSSVFVANQNDVQFFMVNMGASYNVCRAHITWEDPAMDYQVQVSTNRTTWTTIKTVVGNTNLENDWTGLSGVGQYVRIWMTKKVGTWNNYSMFELRVYDQTGIPPTVTLTSPANGAQFNTGTAINVAATANNADRVEFFYEINGNTTEIGSDDFSAPFGTTWTPTQPGIYKVKAIATNTIASVTSNIDTVTIVAESTTGAWLINGNSGLSANHFLGTTDTQNLVFKTNNLDRVTILRDGRVRIGSFGQADSAAKLSVNGTIYAKKLKITQLAWADYVFDKNYKLLTLKEVEQFIKKHKHLPGVTPAREVINSNIDIGETQAMLLSKIEELTLYLIEQNKKIEQLEKKIEVLDRSKKN